MFKKFLIILIVSTTFVSAIKAEWIPLKGKRTSSATPEVTIISDNDFSTVVKFDLSGFEMNDLISEGRTFNKLDLLSDIFTTKSGFPELPQLAKILAIPDHGGVSVEVVKTSEVEVFKNIHVQPARDSWIEGHPETKYNESKEIYKSNEIYPAQLASIEPPSVFRDFRIARLSVSPIRYIPSKNEIHAVSSITIRINYGKGVAVNPKMSSKKPIPPSFGKLYRSFIYNYQNVLDNRYNGEETGTEMMVCIMPDSYVDSFQPYADWKRQSGTDVHITKFSDIGANASNASIIRDYISDIYYEWVIPPTYVLIVGDDGIFPIQIVNYDYSFPNEDYFVEVDGNDYFPEMMIGRITNQNDYKLQVMINKFMKYEKEPYTASTDWFKKGICCSNNEYESQVNTKRIAANLMLNEGGFTSVDTLMSDGSWGGNGCTVDLNEVTTAVNEGRSYLNYRGEGWSDGWWANCYNFTTSYVSSLNNGEKLTFVTSIGCGVAKFEEYGGNCFGEEWLELGTLDSPRGAIAFIGPTSNTHTTYNNRIDKGIYTGMFAEGMDTPGQALLRGKLYMYNVFGPDPMVEYHYRVFCILGDPSIHIWKDVPQAIVATYPSTAPVGYSQPEFVIKSEATGLPIANAQVCLAGDDIFETGTTDSLGVVRVGITPEVEQTIVVTVRGGNVIPLQGSIEVQQSTEQVGPSEYPIIVDLDGNEDGLINPNENCKITFTLKNWGTQTSNNVNATLSVVETDYAEIITGGPISFGNLSPGATFTGDPFQFHVLPACPVGHYITLKLDVTSNSDAWEYNYPEDVLGCELVYSSFIIDDENELEHNFRMDAGETVKVYVKVSNIGVDVASDVTGTLECADPYITIVDASGIFGVIETNATVINSSDHFTVTIDPNCPDDYYADYNLTLNTNNGNYPYETVTSFQIPVGVPMPTDYTGPDEYGYYAYTDSDTLYDQSPEYNWYEINSMGETLNVPNVSNYTKTVELPFPFQYYGIDYDNVRISTDGWIAFGTGSQIQFINYPLPHTDNVNNMVAAFWDDLHEGYYEQGEILYYYDSGNNRFVIEWDGIGHNEFSYTPQREYFQILLLDPDHYTTETGDGEIIVQYKTVKVTRSNTVGIENDAQDIGLQYVYNRGYEPTASPLRNETAIKFTTEAPVVTVSVEENSGVKVAKLEQNVPNPFSINTSINYLVSEKSLITLRIYNINGELVKTLQNGIQLTGNYSVAWDGTNDKGVELSSGMYFYSLSTANSIDTRKMFMIR
jgi:peptidase C25-like protein/flagellar hook capping protein FlgD